MLKVPWRSYHGCQLAFWIDCEPTFNRISKKGLNEMFQGMAMRISETSISMYYFILYNGCALFIFVSGFILLPFLTL